MLSLTFNWFSWSFELKDGPQVLAKAGVGFVRERGSILVEGREFQIRRRGLFGEFELLDGDTVFGSATKPSALKRRFEVAFGNSKYELTAGSFFSRRFVLRKDEKVVGEVRPRSLFNRSAIVDFPDELPPAAKAFLVWLVVILWKRADSSD